MRQRSPRLTHFGKTVRQSRVGRSVAWIFAKREEEPTHCRLGLPGSLHPAANVVQDRWIVGRRAEPRPQRGLHPLTFLDAPSKSFVVFAQRLETKLQHIIGIG